MFVYNVQISLTDEFIFLGLAPSTVPAYKVFIHKLIWKCRYVIKLEKRRVNCNKNYSV